MKKIKSITAAAALIGGFLAFTIPASADWRGHDRRDLAAARQELRHDLRRGAGHREIARDRAVIGRERRELWHDRRDWRHDRWDDRRWGWGGWWR